MNGPIDSTRDYATAAIIRYARLGCPTRSEYEAVIRNQVYEKYRLKSPEYITRVADKEVAARRALLDDIDAVDRMLGVLRGRIRLSGADASAALRNGEDIADAVSFVYFGLCRGYPSHRSIALRVRAYATSLPTTERTVYRWLRSARRLFAVLRGLTIE